MACPILLSIHRLQVRIWMAYPAVHLGFDRSSRRMNLELNIIITCPRPSVDGQKRGIHSQSAVCLGRPCPVQSRQWLPQRGHWWPDHLRVKRHSWSLENEDSQGRSSVDRRVQQFISKPALNIAHGNDVCLWWGVTPHQRRDTESLWRIGSCSLWLE